MVGGIESDLAKLVVSTFTELKSQNTAVLKNQQKILDKLDQVQSTLQGLGQKIDEQTLRDARSGMRHLVDGINSGREKIRDAEFQIARQKFTALIELNPNEVTNGTSGQVDNKILIAFGYYGSFHYFNLYGDKRSAAIQVYECVEKFSEWRNPQFALQMFSPVFFSKDYTRIINNLIEEVYKIQGNSNEESSEFILRSPWEVGYLGYLTGSAVGGGVAFGLASAIGFTGGLLSGPIGWGIMAAGGVSAAIVGNMFPKKEKLPEINASDREKYEQLLKDLQSTNAALYEECKNRKRLLQNTTLDSLISIGMKTFVMPFTVEVENVLRRSDLRISNIDKVTLEGEVKQLANAVNQNSATQAEMSLLKVGNLLRSLSGVFQEFSNLLEKWNGVTEKLNKSGLLRQ